MNFQENVITDNWKDSFPFGKEEPNFYVAHAVINIPVEGDTKGRKIKIEFFDSDQRLVIVTESAHFSMDILGVDLDELTTRWTENDFSKITQPLEFYENVDHICVNDHGTENWFEFILGEEGADNVAEICSKSFELSLVTE